jgi:citrate lyase beta subunit
MQIVSIEELIKLGEFFLAFTSESPYLLSKNGGKIYPEHGVTAHFQLALRLGKCGTICVHPSNLSVVRSLSAIFKYFYFMSLC